MSTQPRFEARVNALERRQINTDTRIEELAEDMTASFKQLSEYLTTMATKEDITQIQKEITEIKTTLAALNQNTLLLLTQILERLPKN